VPVILIYIPPPTPPDVVFLKMILIKINSLLLGRETRKAPPSPLIADVELKIVFSINTLPHDDEIPVHNINCYNIKS
jgi:hypothetical protein